MCQAEMHGLASDAKMPAVRQGGLKVLGDMCVWIRRKRAHDKTSVCDNRGTENVLVQSD